MRCFWACECRTETEVDAKVLDTAGEIFQCPSCKKVYGNVTSKCGSRHWIPINDSLVKFHRLLVEYNEEGEEIKDENGDIIIRKDV